MRYRVVHAPDPYEHAWEFHIVDDEREETIAVCQRIIIADVLCAFLNDQPLPQPNGTSGGALAGDGSITT